MPEHERMYHAKYNMLTDEKREIFYTIITQTYSGGQVLGVVDGPGGTGKTFLYNVLYHKLRSMESLWYRSHDRDRNNFMPNGNTLNRMFKLPLNVTFNTTFHRKRQVKQLIQSIDLFILDEASMIPIEAMKVINDEFKTYIM
jgi:hypothetical protein